ncbi:MAG: hypothetical protein A3I66_06480 [Burkholderiales bacterium RIFCSPLOWO2_02_FULL_57_36]|nr:MAG: hypothetical protein A3I66_06480 [Burkholderiales bacterium RIFCSPLOWO2_02_FULL_57_36]
MFEWIRANEIVLGWMVATSVVTFAAAMIGGPLWVIKIPSDYFVEKKHARKQLRDLGMVKAIFAIGRNLLGAILVLLGALMLVLPGQGLLTILVGIMLLDLPGKYRIARWIVARPPVLQSMNWIRRRAGHAPLVLGD